MGWISRFRASGEVNLADPWDEAVINGAPYDAHQAIRSKNLAAPGDRPDAQIAEEIKRRQLAIITRYVATVRAL